MADNTTVLSCPRGAREYVWRQGDTLAAVAARFGVNEADIRRINPSLTGEPQPGESICVPTLRCPNGMLYVVHKGDTFTSIAKEYGITVAQLSAANPFVEPDVLAVGQVICVPVQEEEEEPTPPAQPDTPDSGGDIIINNNISVCIENVVKKTVLAGECYADLLVKAGLSYILFKLLNPGLVPGSLQVGQEYFVPKDELCCAPVSAGRTYLLQPGDTLQSAAQTLGVSVGALLSRNPSLSPADFVAGASVRY